MFRCLFSTGSVLYELPGMASLRLFVFSHLGDTGDRFLFFGLSILLGVVISHVIERPFLRLRAKWLPSHAESPSTFDDSRPAKLIAQQLSFGDTGARQ